MWILPYSRFLRVVCIPEKLRETVEGYYFVELLVLDFMQGQMFNLAVPGMAVRGMRGMMGDIALSVSSSLGSWR